MKKTFTIFLLSLLFTASGWAQTVHSDTRGLLLPFKDGAEQHAAFELQNMVGWITLDVDGLNTSGPSFHTFPGKGGPMGFITYTPSQTTPANAIDGYAPFAGEKYFMSISSWDGPVNDWLISNELASHPGGVFSFYAKSSFDYAGDDKFKVGYSTTGTNPADFILFNNGNPITPSTAWARFEYIIPAGAKHLAINCVSEAVAMLVDDIQFVHNVAPQAPGSITGFSVISQIGTEIQATLNWVNPTVDFANNTLANMTGVKVYRGTHPMNLTEIADLPSAVGQTMSYVDVLPEGGFYIHRLVPYNSSGNGIVYSTPVTFFGYETVPGAPANITFTQNESLHTVITWDVVDYGAMGGTLENPVVGYTIIRSLGNNSDTLVKMNSSTTFTEAGIPTFNMFKYTILAQTSPSAYGVPAVVSAYSGMNANQVSVTSGNTASDQVFELSRNSIISQSIYTPDQIGSTGLITSISYFGNLGSASTARYKIYMSLTNRETFGTNLNNAIWEFFGDQKLLYDGVITFPSGRNAITIQLDQPFYYDDSNNENVIITLVKPLLASPPSVNPREFYNTPVVDMRTYYANGYGVDLSLISTQPASWSTDVVPTIPSVVIEKRTDYGSLAGLVTLFGDNSPLEDVTITVTPDGSGVYQTETTTTDENGAYSFPALLPGNYLVAFSKDAFNTFETSLTIAANEQLTLDVALDNSLPILISGTVLDASGNGLEGVNMNLTGFSSFSTITNATGSYILQAFAEKQYQLEAFHPLYSTESLSFTSGEGDYTLDPITLNIEAHKPGNVVAVNNEGVGVINWRTPVGYSNETMLGWGSFITAGDAWGAGGDPFIAGIRFETSDLQTQVTEGAELTHVKAYIANYAEIIIKVFEGQNGAQLIHSQPASIPTEGWYTFELNTSLPIDVTKELWIGIEFLPGVYGSYPIGLDDGPNAPDKKGSMLYQDGIWKKMSLTNKNWNIYGIAHNTMDANPTGYKVYRSPASTNAWTQLTSSSITATTFNDATLSSAAPDMYKYGITAEYGSDLNSEKAVSNAIQHNMYFDFTVVLEPDFGTASGAYISIWNDDNFAEAFVPASSSSVIFNDILHGAYNLSVVLDNYEVVELSNISIEENSTINVPLTLLKVKPSNLTATLVENSSSVTLDWTLHETYADQIEKYADFERVNIGNYILKDVDGLETYTYNNFTFPGAGSPMSFMVFNPYSTTPPVAIDAHSGRKFLSAFAGPDGVNNDWLIVPAGSGEFSFKAASLTSSALEKIRVLYSTTGSEVSNFTAFGSVITVPIVWTNYTFDAPAGTKYVAINYVGNDSYILKIDDLTFEKEYSHALSYNIYLDGALVSANVPGTTFELQNLTIGTHIAKVEAVYETGVSEKAEVAIVMVNLENNKASEYRIYPNPTTGCFSLELGSKATVSIIDMHGRILYSAVKEAGSATMQPGLSAGTYMIHVQTAEGVSTQRLVIL